MLSNLVLDELDRELERRGHQFVRYVDDCNIYVRSEKAGRRVMQSLTRFIERRLKLQINTQKSAVARPWHRSFLGFTGRNEPEFRRCIANKALIRFKHRFRELTGRYRGISLERVIRELGPFLRGWAGYFGFSQMRELSTLDSWIRRRLRCIVWIQWKTRGRRYRELRRLRVPEKTASATVCSPKGPWRLSFAEAMHRGFTNARFRRLGLPPWKVLWALNPPNRRGTDPYARWCGRGSIARCSPIPIDWPGQPKNPTGSDRRMHALNDHG